jgi:hypothetical protein
LVPDTAAAAGVTIFCAYRPGVLRGLGLAAAVPGAAFARPPTAERLLDAPAGSWISARVRIA